MRGINRANPRLAEPVNAWADMKRSRAFLGLRLTPWQLAWRVLAGLLALEATVVGLVLAAGWRQRRGRFQGFPHETLPAVPVGENRLQIYSYGQSLYGAMLAAIDSARERIYLETYIWKSDTIGQEFKDRLARQAAEGVEVYVIFDRFGNLVVPGPFKNFPPTIHTLVYQAVRRPWHLVDPRRYALEHRKLLVVDGQVAFLGGYNLGALYATEWRDTHLRIDGPAVAHFAHAFEEFWADHSPNGERIARGYPRQFNPIIALRENDALRVSFPIRGMYISAIDQAQQRIRLCNAYFIPDRVLLNSLKAAARRGVDVQVLVPWVSNHTLADWLARGRFAECLRAGIRIFGYQAMIHAKTCTIDGQWTTIGTANLDRLSSVGNYEINAEIYSRELAEQMERLFERDKTHARELTLERWAARPWTMKLGERILSPLRLLL